MENFHLKEELGLLAAKAAGNDTREDVSTGVAVLMINASSLYIHGHYRLIQQQI
jgi:hypothetical protein